MSLNIAVIGAGGLLGKKIIGALKSRGHRCISGDLNKLEDTSLFFSIDITSPVTVDRFIKKSVDALGKIDAVINAAYPRGRNYGRKFEDVDYDDFCSNVNLHLGGYFNIIQKFAQYFAKNGGGKILNISSIYGIKAPRFDIYSEGMTMPVEYAAIKSAINHITAYTAQYYKKSNVICNVISPGGIFDGHTEEFVQRYGKYSASGKMLDPGEVAEIICELAENKWNYVNGQNIVIDEGWGL